MNSDGRDRNTAEADRQILAELDDRTACLQTGERAPVGDLEQQDPYGAEAFAALARRYGLGREDGGWVLGKKPRWRPGWMTAEHDTECLDLFEAAFGYRMDQRLWLWKYRDAPARGVGVWRDGRLVGFYGAMPRPVLFRGQPTSAVQIGDVMVHPHERGVLTRSGPFQIAASTFIDRSVGYHRPHLFGFGFPTSKALQVAQKLGLYEQADQMAEVAWEPGHTWQARLLRCVPLRPSDRRAVDQLWRAMAADFSDSIIGVRDAQYVERRYRAHPTVAYECLLVRRVLTGAAQGVVVLRRQQDEAELVDLIGPRRAFPALIAAARDWAGKKRAARLKAWVTASHASVLAATGASVTPMDLVVPANVWSPGPAVAELRDRWWLMAGDTDFR